MLASDRRYLIKKTVSEGRENKSIFHTFRPRPFAMASKVSRTWITRSRVGSTTKARKRITAREERVYSPWSLSTFTSNVKKYVPLRSGERKRASSRFQWERKRRYHSGDHTGGTETASGVLE